MKNTVIPFVVFMILAIWIFPFSIIAFLGDYAASFVPGWNTTISYNWLAAITKSIVLFFVVIGYWKLHKRKIKISRNLFLFHLALTIPSLIELKYPLYTFLDPNAEPDKFMDALDFILAITTILSLMFFIAQIAFAIYYSKLNRQATANSMHGKSLNN
jgi:membrane-associated HD superfamily phosphohydrolase